MVVGVQCNAIDLTYPMDDATIFWPGGEKFKLCMKCCVSEEHGFHYAAGVFSCAEHGGTHVDAPFHFAKDGITVDLIPLQDLIAPCAVLDISAKCTAAEGEYALTAEDIEQHEREHGRIEERSILLVRTGWARYWRSGPKAYLGFDESTDGPYDSATTSLRFPGIGVDAAGLLIARKVSAVGLDTASLDPGSRQDFAAHCALLGAGIYGIENVNGNIDQLPATGCTLVVMPMKIAGGSGAPARVTALLPKPVAAI